MFFLIDDKIVQSRIVAFNNTAAFNDYDTMIIATLNRTSKEKLQYSGVITFYNAFQNKLLANEYSKGFRIQSGALSLRIKKSITAKTNGCTDWYWVTNYADGRQFNEYLYTTCNDCEEMAYKTLNGCGGGGGGGGEGQTNSIFPASPIDNAIVNYFSPEGEHIKYQYINGIWKIILISLPDIVIKTVRESRPYLIFDWPENNQKVVAEGFVYTYDSESGNWEGVPIDDLKIINELTNPCAKNIFTNLHSGLYTENPLKPEVLILSDGIDLNFSQEILKLFENSRYTDLTIRNDLLTGDANASTVGATITINNSYLANATQLSVARTIIHETVHAFLNAYFFAYPDFQDKPFQTQLRNYASEKGFTDINTFHHNFMGQYIDAVAYSLYEWDKGFGTGGNLGWEYYKSMAYSGMFQVDPSGSIVAEVDTFKEIVPNANDRQ